MNVLFVSISNFSDLSLHSISADLLREFVRNGHNVHIVCALDSNSTEPTHYSVEYGVKIVRVKIGKNKKANIIQKGITTLTEPNKYITAIKRYFSDVRFDLVMYPTPPVTQEKTVEFVKKRDGAVSYLLLKDIFPQNAVDIGMMRQNGVKGFLYRHFRRVEKRLYRVSDRIGCMSPANVEYVLKQNPEVDPGKVGICPNAIEVVDRSIDGETRAMIRKKYGIPLDRKVFVYGGNLGKPQGIPFVIECLKACRDSEKAFFLIVGDGTEYGKLETYANESEQANMKLMKKLPREDYDSMASACDVGLIFLDHRFTIPNFPSRLLSYMQAKLPVLACTDPNTDVGKVITEGGFGWWCESDNPDTFDKTVGMICSADTVEIGEKGYRYLLENYTSELAYRIIMNDIEK